MKAVLISIRPYYVFLIIAKTMGWSIDKEKTVEVRKRYPTDKEWNKAVKIYCSKDKKSFAKIPKEYQPVMDRFLGKVIGEFVCDKICAVLAHPDIFAGRPLFFQYSIDAACLTQDEVEKYSGGKDVAGLVISDLKVYKTPKELSEYRRPCSNDLDCESCGMHSEYSGKCGNAALQITRPPQSWCYVKEAQQGGMCEK